MTKENKKLLKETTEILKQLDRNSLELIRTGAVCPQSIWMLEI